MKHTKGPWKVSHKVKKRKYFISGHCWRNFAKVWSGAGTTNKNNDEAYANALLISKSPEILEALKDLQERVIRCRTILEDGHGGDWNILDTKKSESLLKELK